MTSLKDRSLLVKHLAGDLGFNDCGIVKVHDLEEDRIRLEQWLSNGYHATMNWMANSIEKRTDPGKLIPGARSVILVLQNYYPSDQQLDRDAPRISKYAYGKDYHKVLKEKLNRLLGRINEEIAHCKGRVFVDSAPVAERALARLAGLGWIGKNSLLLSRKFGSFFFIGEIITDLELTPDSPIHEYCGECTRCIDACPTRAIVMDKTVDSNRCISYLTIEHSDEIPDAFRSQFNNWIFGCDICQDVCPWNHHAHPHNEPGLHPNPRLLSLSKEDWLGLTEEQYNELFEGSAVKRMKYSGLKRNLEFLRIST